MDLRSLHNRIAHLAGAVPRNLPEAGTTTEAVDLALAAGLVLARIEEWASTRPGFEPMEPPTVLHQPTDADRRMAAQCPALAELGEKHLTHSADAIAARLEKLLSQYRATGQPDDAIESALADVRERLAAFDSTGAHIPQWCSRFLTQIAGNPAAQSTTERR